MMTPPLLQYFWFHSIYSLAASCSLQMSYTVVVDTICAAPVEGIIIFGYWALSGSKQGRDQGGGAQNIIEWYFVQL